ncbi:MAG: hypothetical protein C0614_04740 [Desulfuromonas sp.]|nr:MAG: hypothetical protein C0614_04740 [Desulfuromonas sp.]
MNSKQQADSGDRSAPESPKMKKFVIMVVCWMVFVATVLIGSVVYERFKTSPYDVKAIPYVQKVVPVISSWDVEQIRPLMAPESLAEISEERLQETVKVFARVGELKKLDTPRFSHLHSEAGVDNASQTIVEYKVGAEYSSGEAEMTINLLHNNGAFSVYHFTLGSKVLMP